MKLIEKILVNKEYCEKIAQMSCEAFAAELAVRGIELKDIDKAYNIIKITAAGGEINDDELDVVAGGVGFCECKGALC